MPLFALLDDLATFLLKRITIIEFERMFDDEEMKAFFQSIEINAVDATRPFSSLSVKKRHRFQAWTLFDSLDVNGDHTISLEVET